MITDDDIERFWSKVNRLGSDDCWLWIAGKFSDGYGAFRLSENNRRAHRVSWEIHSVRELAKKFRTGKTTIYNVVTGRTWRHVPIGAAA